MRGRVHAPIRYPCLQTFPNMRSNNSAHFQSYGIALAQVRPSTPGVSLIGSSILFPAKSYDSITPAWGQLTKARLPSGVKSSSPFDFGISNDSKTFDSAKSITKSFPEGDAAINFFPSDVGTEE